jgi:hypothetical protein
MYHHTQIHISKLLIVVSDAKLTDFFSFLLFLVVLGFELRALYWLGRHSALEPHFQPQIKVSYMPPVS